ncbi:MAG: putative cytochrome c oxidase subunit [Ilumatobacteraceae bacterium]|nr:putative cytochrome c oxidase subunit [Ilumatobacteraceae bacterium]
MLAIHSGPAPAPRRQLFVGTAVACAGMITLIGGMLATWMRFRQATITAGNVWVPKRIQIPQVSTNVMLIAFVPLCVFAQWAVYAARRDDRPNTGLALGLTGIMGLSIINAQAYTFNRIALPASGGAYNSMFYAITGTFTALAIIGVGFTAVTAFRYLGGRSSDREIIAAHALYWYSLSAVFAALWFVVYVTK